MSNKIQIISGPSREELFDGLRLLPFNVPFTVVRDNEKYRIKTRIIGIQTADGGGQSWKITFEVLKAGQNEKFLNTFNELYVKKDSIKACFGAFYSTKSRLGEFDF